MMNGRGKSDSAIVAERPTNKAGQPAEEPVERRAGPGGMRTSKARTGLRARLACHRRWSVYGKQLPLYTRGGAVCGKAARTVLYGGRDENRVPTATSTPRFGHPSRRCGCVAARGAAAAGQADARWRSLRERA